MKNKLSGPDQVQERFGVTPERVVDVLGLAGDTSDNIPGVPGVGEKTAIKLVQQYSDIEGVLKWSHLVSGKKLKENLHAYADQARLSKELVSLRYDVPVEVGLDDLRRREPDLDKLLPLLDQLEFGGLATAFTPPEPGVVEIYSDGSAMPAGPGGYGVILRFGAHEKELSGFEAQTTSQRMELAGAIAGLQALNGSRRIKVISDSQYLIKGMSEWIFEWVKNGRLEGTHELDLANRDLWQQLFTLSLKHQIEWTWVKGHAGHPFNERCDRLARAAVDANLPKAEPAAQGPPEEVPLSEPQAGALPAPTEEAPLPDEPPLPEEPSAPRSDTPVPDPEPESPHPAPQTTPAAENPGHPEGEQMSLF